LFLLLGFGRWVKYTISPAERREEKSAENEIVIYTYFHADFTVTITSPCFNYLTSIILTNNPVRDFIAKGGVK
jgi:hypothetical protein